MRSCLIFLLVWFLGCLPVSGAESWQETNQAGVRALLSGDYSRAESQFELAREQTAASSNEFEKVQSLSNLASVHTARALQAEEALRQAATSRVVAVAGLAVFILMALVVGALVLRFFPVKPKWYKDTQEWVAQAKAKTPNDLKGTGFYMVSMFVAFSGAAVLFLVGISTFLYVLSFIEREDAAKESGVTAHYKQAGKVLGDALYGDGSGREATTAEVLYNYSAFLKQNGQSQSSQAALVAERLNRYRESGNE